MELAEKKNISACCYLAKQIIESVEREEKKGSVVTFAPELRKMERYAHFIAEKSKKIRERSVQVEEVEHQPSVRHLKMD